MICFQEDLLLGLKKKKNVNWKGGKNQYHRNRMLKIYKECVLCKSDYKLEMHHRDGNHENNERLNRIIICKKCHDFWHYGK